MYYAHFFAKSPASRGRRSIVYTKSENPPQPPYEGWTWVRSTQVEIDDEAVRLHRQRQHERRQRAEAQ
jgi:hypothetical protein